MSPATAAPVRSRKKMGATIRRGIAGVIPGAGQTVENTATARRKANRIVVDVLGGCPPRQLE
jgi:hypothetical protein